MEFDPLDLVACASVEFPQRAKRAIALSGGTAQARADLAVALLTALSEAANLSESEKAIRARIILTSSPCQISAEEWSRVARCAADFSPGLKNAVAAAVPIEVRPEVYGRVSSAGVTSIEERRAINVPTTEHVERFSDVLLLSPGATHEANSNLLSRAGFAPLRVENLRSLETLLRTSGEACAVAIDQSFWAVSTLPEVESAVRLVSSYSTFSWLRLADDGLPLSPTAVQRIMQEERCHPGEFGPNKLYLRHDGRFSESELAILRGARDSLRTALQSAFLPDELSTEEADLLWAAIQTHAHKKSFYSRFSIPSIKTKFLKGGLTSARVALVLLTEKLLPVVVKVDSKDAIKDEATRFLRFIAPRDRLLRPEVHFHWNSALLLFGVVGDTSDDDTPAPQLESRLRDLWYAQLFGSIGSRTSPTVGDLIVGVRNAVKKLGRLNREAIGECSTPSYSEPHVKAVQRLEEAGVSWGFDEICLVARRTASTLFRRHANRATVHGDVQLRNVLLRSDREAFLIDYAGSGPGHPAIDLVRLEMALFLGAFRENAPGSETVKLQADLSMGLLSLETLKSSYGHITQLHINEVVLTGCLDARQEAIRVLAEYGGDFNDYLAVKILVAWQALQIPDLQQGLARAVIVALAPLLAPP
jgi:hypothetical protein